MELRLQRFIEALELTTNIYRQQEAPIVVRTTDDATGASHVVCCSYHQPKYVLLPIQAIWIDFNPESATYRHAHKRVTKGATPDGDVWEVLYFYDDAFPDQEYDPADTGMVSITLPPPASTLVHGIGLLSAPSDNSIVVVNGDLRLNDNRDPRDHNHPENPATIIRTGDGTSIPIMSQTAPVLNSVLAGENNGGAPAYVWRRLKENDLEV